MKIIHNSGYTEDYINEMYKLITLGGQIKLKPEILLKQIRNSEYLAFEYRDGKTVACAAIKCPQNTYRKKVFRHANVEGYYSYFRYEIGYCVTLPDYTGRGISTSLIKRLLNKMPDTNFFATTKADSMRHILQKTGFEKFGNTYITEDGDKIDLYRYIYEI